MNKSCYQFDDKCAVKVQLKKAVYSKIFEQTTFFYLILANPFN